MHVWRCWAWLDLLECFSDLRIISMNYLFYNIVQEKRRKMKLSPSAYYGFSREKLTIKKKSGDLWTPKEFPIHVKVSRPEGKSWACVYGTNPLREFTANVMVEVIVVLSKTPLEINLLVVYPYDSFLISLCRIWNSGNLRGQGLDCQVSIIAKTTS